MLNEKTNGQVSAGYGGFAAAFYPTLILHGCTRARCAYCRRIKVIYYYRQEVVYSTPASGHHINNGLRGKQFHITIISEHYIPSHHGFIPTMRHYHDDNGVLVAK